jgi:hypothetical protein
MSPKANDISHKNRKGIKLVYLPSPVSQEDQNEKVDRAFDLLFEHVLKANKNK